MNHFSLGYPAMSALAVAYLGFWIVLIFLAGAGIKKLNGRN
jgi:hypothetical protein